MPVMFQGLDELRDAIIEKANLDDVKTVVKNNGGKLQQTMMRKANFHGHYEWIPGKGKCFVPPTGTTKRFIELDIRDDGLTAQVNPTTEYSPYLEYGTRYMAAQPFVGPAFNEVKGQFKADLEKLVK